MHTKVLQVGLGRLERVRSTLALVFWMGLARVHRDVSIAIVLLVDIRLAKCHSYMLVELVTDLVAWLRAFSPAARASIGK